MNQHCVIELDRPMQERVNQAIVVLMRRGTVLTSKDLIKYLDLQLGERRKIPLIYKYVEDGLGLVRFRERTHANGHVKCSRGSRFHWCVKAQKKARLLAMCKDNNGDKRNVTPYVNQKEQADPRRVKRLQMA